MQNTKIFKGKKLEIKENVLTYDQEAIQLSNVSQIRIDTEPPQDYPIRYILGICFGLFFAITFRKVHFVMIAAGVVVFVLCALLYSIYEKNQNLEKYLIIELNSGRMILFSAEGSGSFLDSAMSAMIECFNDHGKHMRINFHDCQIENSNIGDHGNVNSGYYRSARRDKEYI